MECNLKTYVAYCDGFSSGLGAGNLVLDDGLDQHIAFALGRLHAAEHQEKRQLLTYSDFLTTFKKWTAA